MRWSYKTIHYELKKEGILGSAFLDESEIELSLNQYGKAGWELVSLLETLDGLIAVFKQPLGLDTGKFAGSPPPVEKGERPQREERRKTVETDRPPVRQKPSVKLDDEVAEAVLLDDFEVVAEKSPEEVKKKRVVPPVDIGSIRIE